MKIIWKDKKLFLILNNFEHHLKGSVKKISDCGVRAQYTNSENSNTIKEILYNLSRDKILISKLSSNLNIFPESVLDVLIAISPLLCAYYATPECNFKTLNDLSWRHIIDLRIK